MTNPFYSSTNAIVRFTRANAAVVQGEFTKIEQAFDDVNDALAVNRLAATSASTVAIGTGTKSFLATTQRGFAPGQFVIVASSTSVTSYMIGQVEAYDPDTGAMTINVSIAVGSGTYSAWSIALGPTGNSNSIIPGQLLVGLTSSAYKAEVAGDFRISGGGDLRIGTSTTGSDAQIYNDGGTLHFNIGASIRGVMASDGRFIWGATSPIDEVGLAGFQVRGAGGIAIDTTTTAGATAMSFFNGQGPTTRVGWIGTSGSSTSYNTSSDARLKENIEDAQPAGAIIDDLRVRQFDWKLDGAHQRYGMIAQELLEVFPEAVALGANATDMMAVDYSKLVPLLLDEVKSLRARVAVIEAGA